MQTTIEMNNPTARMQLTIEEKRKQNKQLKLAVNDYITLKHEYLQKTNEALLTTDFKKVLDESRPTVAMKEAYIDNLYYDEKLELAIAKENISCIKRDIEILNDEIKLYELQTQLELKE